MKNYNMKKWQKKRKKKKRLGFFFIIHTSQTNFHCPHNSKSQTRSKKSIK